MIEDESGRIRLVGDRLKSAQLVTGVIVSVLGIETGGGDFEVVDICFAGLAPQPKTDSSSSTVDEESMDVDGRPLPFMHIVYLAHTTRYDRRRC